MEAAKKWLSIPQNVREMLVKNVFCSNCGVTEIVKYTIEEGEYAPVLKGECKTCGRKVARVID
ncbi:hypothetical protein AJ85_19045 [Alkalihalobacillus alcalophilus ATCC 27647 = CGMCC 1.3604]|uniref:Uncharacterized protein n=1 Tax=Alkalihalobacillus alcalophilus ATCC 27647 = CGMCC 1.3604 TaxID=1218173 RepID=A0A094YZI4_ALKAL|nr:hypothetical protein [Alkalihalobacillus alcalophilus]KGA98977.1 hypothetical protein BALCAV_0201655 [Alkalihalobacillus alcalophilus ATCC 27647 = CGMCC 1.3604]MED1562018.1 hypothetical protein [Alkalihalobacillus alcalophilus]THG89208.1 hypothetical protein AJ85_19045 [Alkalihalobacillus alcalophilus ATCC 27647 = CGMCC 1.3604]